MDFKYLIVDANNLGYVVLNTNIDRSIAKVSNKFIYPQFVKRFIETIDLLKKIYSSEEVVLLFDNHTSKEELRMAFKVPSGVSRKDIKETYKSTRKRETNEFYWSLDFLKYYFTVTDTYFHTVQILKLEADDLVAPCLRTVVKDSTALMITNDSDWTKYLSTHIYYLPEINGNPQGREAFFSRYGFYPSEDKVILYKILNGDSADDIPMVFPEIKPAIRSQIINDFNSVFDLMLHAHEKIYLKPFISLIKDRENDIKVNYQLLSNIDVSDEQFLSHFTTGRGSGVLKASLNKILYGDTSPKKFTFGGLKLPRVNPKN